MDILQAKNIIKKFGDFTAVDNISFSLREGEILGFLGPNGAGKTTTLQILLGALKPTSGEIIYFGKELDKYREEILEKINFSSTYTNLPWWLTVKENLTFITYLYDIKDRKKRIEEIIATFKLEILLSQRMSELSAGQLTRVNLAKAFINKPKILLLDEPTASLDPDIASYIRRFLLKERHDSKISIIFTSHNMSEVEEVCDRIIFINMGKIVADDTPTNLAKVIKISHLELLIEKNMEKIKKYCKRENLKYKLNGKRIIIDINESKIPDLLRDLTSQEIYYDEISIERPNLEDYFIQTAQTKL
ncbi:ABC transporter ATP-binding protein [Candidatus Daviesbacteria bacterium]|nr:ABC transporter ATP-binding protein [Candidatus Daviesbacteria bacterium]